jgi:hypothetical protein
VEVLLDDLGAKRSARALEHDLRSGVQLLARVHQRLPPVGVRTADQQAFDGTARGVAAAEQPGWEDPGVVENEEVALAEELGQGADAGVGEDGAGRAVEHEKPRRLALGRGLLRNLVGREVKIEQGHVHADSVARQGLPAAIGSQP